MACQGFIERDAENHVATLIAAVTDHVLPLFLVIVVLLLGPGLAGSEINCLRVLRPGEGVDFVGAGGDGKSLATAGRNQEQLGDVFIFIFVCVFVVSRVCIFGRCDFSFRKKHDPLAVGRPLRRAVVAGLSQLRQAPVRGPVEPELFAEDLLLPVSAFRFDDDRVAIRRNFHRGEAHRVEEFVESELGLCGLGVGQD